MKFNCEGKPKLAFVCVHNSCRSQMAEAIAKLYASDFFEIYSAGTEKVDKINPDAVRLIKDRFGVDMELTQYSKTLDEIPSPDIVIKMGCNVSCPILPSQYSEDWGLDDPTGKSDDAFLFTIHEIMKKLEKLITKVRK